MIPYYLRIEAVNMANVLSDTQDLSTARGGGLLQLEAVRHAHAVLIAACKKVNVTQISKGASVGLFKFNAASPKDAQCIRGIVASKLAIHPKHRHSTFVVDVTPVSGEYRKDIERLIALNHRRQACEPSIIFPEWNSSRKVKPDDYFDRLRPAVIEVYVPPDPPFKEKKEGTSESVMARREHGRKERRLLYKRLRVTSDRSRKEPRATRQGYSKEKSAHWPQLQLARIRCPRIV